MSKMLNLIKNNIPAIIISIIIGGTFQITANSNIPSIGVSYANDKTAETTVNGALDELFSAVDLNEQMMLVKGEILDLKDNLKLINKIYPVGSIYISTSNTNPGTLFEGTTWEIYGENRMLMGVGTSSNSEKTGGSSSVTLTTSQLPSHTHSIPALSGTAASNGAHTHSVSGTAASAGAHQHYLFRNSTPTGYTSSSGSYAASNSGAVLAADYQYDIYAHTSAPNVYLTSSNGAHTHSVSGTAASAGAHTHSVSTTASTTGSNGSGTEINIQNPYITVYMWKRTA